MNAVWIVYSSPAHILPSWSLQCLLFCLNSLRKVLIHVWSVMYVLLTVIDIWESELSTDTFNRTLHVYLCSCDCFLCWYPGFTLSSSWISNKEEENSNWGWAGLEGAEEAGGCSQESQSSAGYEEGTAEGKIQEKVKICESTPLFFIGFGAKHRQVRGLQRSLKARLGNYGKALCVFYVYSSAFTSFWFFWFMCLSRVNSVINSTRSRWILWRISCCFLTWAHLDILWSLYRGAGRRNCGPSRV